MTTSAGGPDGAWQVTARLAAVPCFPRTLGKRSSSGLSVFFQVSARGRSRVIRLAKGFRFRRPFLAFDIRSRPKTFSIADCLAAVSIVAVCTLSTVQASTSVEPAELAPMLSADTAWVADLDSDGRLWLGYYSQDSELLLRRPDGQIETVARPSNGSRPAGLTLAPLGEAMGFLWRSSGGLDVLNLLDTSAMERRRIESPVPVLTRMRLKRLGDRTLVLWYGDAKRKPDPERYQIFLHWFESGDKQDATESVMPGFYPEWIVDQDGTIAVFSWTRGVDDRKVVMRRLVAGAEEFNPVQEIAETGRVTPIFQSFRSGNRWFVVWVGQYGEGGSELLLQGTWSDDQGETWNPFAFESLRGFDVSHLSVATDHEGQLFLAVSGNRRFQDPDEREDVILLRSMDNGSTFDPPNRLRGDGSSRFHGRNPNVALGPDPGQVFVVWEDWDGIRPRVKGSLSRDAGGTWKSMVLLSSNPGANYRLVPGKRSLFKTHTGLTLISERFDDTLTGKELVRSDVLLDEIEAVSEGPVSEADEGSLRDRVRTYWQSMQKGDYQTTYAMLDPFFRARWTEANYLKRMGLISYKDFEIIETEHRGPLADVQIRFKASAEMGMRHGRAEPLEREGFMVERWLWVDGNWYREVFEETTDTRYTQY